MSTDWPTDWPTAGPGFSPDHRAFFPKTEICNPGLLLGIVVLQLGTYAGTRVLGAGLFLTSRPPSNVLLGVGAGLSGTGRPCNILLGVGGRALR